jgi:hypothetical protein
VRSGICAGTVGIRISFHQDPRSAGPKPFNVTGSRGVIPCSISKLTLLQRHRVPKSIAPRP